MRPFIVLAILLGVIGLSFSIDVSSCDVINAPGSYVLTTSVSGAPNGGDTSFQVDLSCIVINSSSVTFDCAGFSITRPSAPSGGTDYAGILVNPDPSTTLTGITIRNCPNIQNYTFHILARNITSSSILNNTVFGTYPNWGIRCDDDCTDLLIQDNTVSGGYGGILVLNGGSDNVINNNVVLNNDVVGIEIESDFTNVTNNEVTGGETFFTYYLGSSATNARFEDNIATGVGIGFYIQGDNSDLINNVVSNNTGFGTGFDIGGDGNTITQCVAFNNAENGFEIGGTGNTVTNNTADSNGGFGFTVSGDGNDLSTNIAHDNGGAGFYVGFASFNSLDSNTAYLNGGDGFQLNDSFAGGGGDSFNNITNSFSFNNSGNGFRLTATDNNTLDGNAATDNSLNGFLLESGPVGFVIVGSNDNVLTDNSASGNGQSGLSIQGSDSVFVDPSFFCNNFVGITVLNSNSITITDSVACNNTLTGINVTNSTFTNLTNNTASDNGFYNIYSIYSNDSLVDSNIATGGQDGFVSIQETNALYQDNVASGYSGYGFYTPDTTDSVFTGNSVTAGPGGSTGFYVSQSASDNQFIDNTASGNSNYGFRLESTFGGVINNTFDNNTAHSNNVGFALLCSVSTPVLNNYIGNDAYNNSLGFSIQCADNTFTGTTLWNNSQGIMVAGVNNTLVNTTVSDTVNQSLRVLGNGTVVDTAHLFDNGFDMEVSGSLSLQASGIVFDNPAGNFADFTNVSFNDTLASQSYHMNWSALPGALPSSVNSFENKHLRITNTSAGVSIDTISWKWQDSEASGYDENRLELWEHDGSWSEVGSAVLDTGANTLSVSGLSGFSVFSIVESFECPAPITSPGSYSLIGDVIGSPNPVFGGYACIAITASNVDFDCQGFSVTGNDLVNLTFGASLYNVTNVTLRNCVITNYTNAGVDLADASGNFVLNNTAYDNVNVASGFLLTGSASGSHNNTFVDNVAFGNNISGFHVIFSSSDNVFTDNVAFENVFAGFLSGNGSGNNFSGNVAFNHPADGFWLNSATSGMLFNNTAFNNTNGFHVQTVSTPAVLNTLDSNIAFDNTVAGFMVDADQNSLLDNIAFDNNRGIYVTGSSNNLSGNTANTSAQQGFLVETGSGNLLSGNYAADNSDPGFLVRFGATNNTLSGNTAVDNLNTGFFMDSGSNTLSDNLALSNDGAGFFVNSAGNTLTSNNATETDGPGFYLFTGGSGTILSGNLAFNHDDEGFLVLSDSNTFLADLATNNTYGFLLDDADGNSLTDVNASGNTIDGLLIDESNNVLVDPSFFCDNLGNGVTVADSINVTILDSVACNNTLNGFEFSDMNASLVMSTLSVNNSARGFMLSSDSTGNTFDNNTAQDNDDVGFLVTDSDGNGFTMNNATGNGLSGFAVAADSDSNTFNGDVATLNTFDGFIVGVTSDNNTFVDVTGSFNGLHGFEIFGASSGNTVDPSIFCGNAGDGVLIDSSDNNTIADNAVCGNTLNGIELSSSDGNTLSNNIASANGLSGFRLGSSDSTSMDGNTAFANVQGTYVIDSNGTSIAGDHYYNNTLDFNVTGTNVTVNLSGVVFDNPTGNLSNYTNLSVSDVVASAYSIDHAVQPAALPPDTLSFEGKFVDITNSTANVSVDSGLWHWLDSEASSYNEANLFLYYFNGASWMVMNSTPDTAGNDVGLAPVTDFGVYALLVYTGSDSDGGDDSGPSEGLELDINPLCNGFVMTVKDSDGDPVADAFVEVTDETHGSEFSARYTDSEGKAYYTTCGIDISATATKSGEDGALSDFAACGICEECSTDDQCAANEQCDFGFCEPVQCSCGQVQDHACVQYQCCSDAQCPTGEVCLDNSCVPEFECDLNGPGPEDDNADCGNTEYCDVLPGNAGGSCKDVTGQCGYASNHEWAAYECGPEAGCPACPQGTQCVDHLCVENDLECPADGFVGTKTTCRATTESQPCPLCDLLITGPDGKNFTGKTGPDGSFSLPLQLSGIYKIALLDANGTVIKLTQVRALATGVPDEGQPPTGTSQDPLSLLWLLILLLLVVLGIVYWRRRKAEKK